MAGMSSLESLEQSVLNTLLVARPGEGITDISDWEPLAHPVPDTTLDGRPMKGTTNLEHLVLVGSLDSGLMAGMSRLEPFEQSVLNKLLVARPGDGITEKISDWEPVAHPVPDTSLDDRPMEGTTNLEHSVLVGSLDSGLIAGMSSLEPLEQSVLSTLLVARPVEVLTETDTPERSALASQLDYGQSNLELSARPMLDPIQDGYAELDTDPSERSAPMTHVDFGLLQLDAQSRPMVNVALGRYPMEGITDPLPVESSGLALAPDSGHMEHLPSSGLLEHSVLDVKWRNDNLNSSNKPQFGSDLGHSSLELEDAIRREVLKSRSMGRGSARDVNGLLLSPENACLGDKEMSLDEVRSEGLRQWNMDMDVEYQYETFNGLPVYYGGEMYDSEESEEYDPLEMVSAAFVEDYNFDVPEGMELMTYAPRRPDGGETRGVNAVDMVPMCRTVSGVIRLEPDESSDTSSTDTAELEESNIEEFCLWTDLWDEEDCPVSNAGSIVDNSVCMSNQDDLSCVDVASLGDFDREDSDDAIGFDSDEGSMAELEWSTWGDACAWEFQNVSGNFPPCSAVALPAVILKDSVYCIEDYGFPEWAVCCTGHDICRNRHGYVDGDIYLARLCLLGRPGPRDIREREDEEVNVRRLNHRHTICWHADATDYRPLAVCYDCLCLISLSQTIMSLSYDGEGALEWIGHGESFDCSPAGELGYLPRCLCSLLVMDRMTQYLTEIKGPGWSLMLRKAMYAGDRRRVCTRGTPPEACSAGRILLALIGHWASVGGSVSHTDWSCVNGAVDKSPGGVWIDCIRQALGDSQSIIVMPVTGSLVSPTLFSCWDAICTARSSLYWTVGGMDWVLPAGYQVLLLEFAECWTMDAVAVYVLWHTHQVRYVSACSTCHLELAQLWRCPVSWCTVWKGTPQDLMDHVRGAHNVPGEIKKVSLETLFPPWTVTRQVYIELLTF